jgi:DNA-binding MarR family transcriptional regulator
VDRLEGEGLVRRTPSEVDRRTVHVALTPEGTTAFETMAEGHEAEVARLFAGLTDDELDQMTAILKRIGR